MPKYLVRLIGLFIVAAALVLTVRSLLVPKTFWQYGHYRGAAIGEIIAAQQPRYAGRAACGDCHGDKVDMKDFRHARVPCETCHGPAREHATADDPAAKKPPVDLKRDFCLRCHEGSLARPKQQPQVDRDPKAHKNGEENCKKCHTIHTSAPKTHKDPTASPMAEGSPAPAAPGK